ncbi:MAG: S8 family serine peptidase [bacterium]|nr:S8 family serine peptidase [bacterium]
MIRRTALLIIAMVCLWSVVATAAVVDQSIYTELANVRDGEMVKVLMLMDSQFDLSELDRSLEGASPSYRREAVMSAMRQFALDSQNEALTVLDSEVRSGHAARPHTLVLANAISFQADSHCIEQLANSRSAGTLYSNNKYLLVSDAVQSEPVETTSRATAWGVSWVYADDVWSTHGITGDGIAVGHLDSGVWMTHPDLVNGLWVNPGEIAGNGIDDDGNGYIDDVNGYDFGDDDPNPNDDASGAGHGTHTAGTVVGDGTGGTATGCAPGADLIACKVADSSGSMALGSVWEALDYVVNNGARVITMSLGIPGEVPASYMRTERNLANGIRAAGTVFFNSSGNEHYAESPPTEVGMTARVPAPWNPMAVPYSSCGGVIAVGGTSYQGYSYYTSSSRGPVHWGDVDPWNDWDYTTGNGLTKPDVAAPGTNVNSTTVGTGYSGNTWSGTSMACPHAAGVAALILEKNPSLSPAGVDSIMEQSANDLGTVGKDVIYGSGLIDAMAAIAATPTATVPHLVATSFTLIDASGDGAIDPGESFELVFDIDNNGTVSGTSVTAGLAVGAGSSITVTDGSGSFGTIAAGGSADNSGDTFALTCDGGAVQGETFSIYLTMYAQNGYEKTMDFSYYVGLPDWRTHNAGMVLGTVTDAGSIGWMSTAQTEGAGFGPEGVNGLYIGSLWCGTGSTYICNNDFSDSDNVEWVVSDDPNGRVRDNGADVSDQDFSAIFTDAGHASPKDIVVEQETFAFGSEPNDDFIIFRYTVRNEGTTNFMQYWAGIFCDWDIGDSGANQGATDQGRQASYMYGANQRHYGVALLGDAPLENLSLISNPDHVYPSGYIVDSIKGRYLKGLLNTSPTPSSDDWSAITSAGPVTLNAGDEYEFVFAMVYGDNLADFLDNVDAAAAVDLGDGVSAIDPSQIPAKFKLAQNSPNPFNPMTAIKFNVETEGSIRLGVYSLTGKLVRTLANSSYTVGEHSVVWDGRSNDGSEMSSGMYLYKLESAGSVITKKMSLVR